MKAGRPTATYRDVGSLTETETAEFSRRYWDTSEARQAIEAASGLRSIDFGRIVGTRPSGEMCGNCQTPMIWRSRQARDAAKSLCPTCGHRLGERCRCASCIEEEDRRYEDERRAAERARRVGVQKWETTYGSRDYLGRALKELTPAQRTFLAAVRENWGPRLDWELIADCAGIQDRWIDPYLQRFRTLSILYYDGAVWHMHPVLFDLPPLLVSD